MTTEIVYRIIAMSDTNPKLTLHRISGEALEVRADEILSVEKQSATGGARIMLTRENFGSGSSREHAVWALDGLGIEAVVGESFADIFKSNCFQGGMLTIELPKADIDYLMERSSADPSTEVLISLASQEVSLADGSWSRRFEIDPFRKYRLERGLDDISMTLEYSSDIEAFEAGRDYELPDATVQ